MAPTPIHANVNPTTVVNPDKMSLFSLFVKLSDAGFGKLGKPQFGF